MCWYAKFIYTMIFSHYLCKYVQTGCLRICVLDGNIYLSLFLSFV
jgi:hypothetical protein